MFKQNGDNVTETEEPAAPTLADLSPDELAMCGPGLDVMLAQALELLARTAAAVEAKAEPAELLNTTEASRMLGIGACTMRAYDVAGLIPTPIRLTDRCKRWRRSELLAWIVAGCPRRETWQFPTPIRLTDRCTRWRWRELLAWVIAGCPRRENWHWPD